MVKMNVNSSNTVKSTAVVKHTAVQSPVTFALLQCNTDLNLPPSNWLSSSLESYGLQLALSTHTGFSSFKMADMFPDCVGEVDVISDAENVKKLLKLSYSRGPVSMIIHRIKTTLLIDDFDIYKYLLKNTEDDWRWIQKLILERIFPSTEDTKQCITNESKRRCALQQENLVSKFLYHSLDNAGTESHPVYIPPPPAESNQRQKQNTDNSPPLPDSNLQDELVGLCTDHVFVRNVVWTFEDIQMLLGTDMPIFGGGTHPCISLRLNDMSKPINVLTGIDYWLDNLMCNVPELAMCYHSSGIVKKYEVIKTEDLPKMEGSKFSPNLIRDVAQNILAFLKSNATKAGHTYWLLKGKDDDVVKLYDLNSLYSDEVVENGRNPFTIPVALLLYRVARNIKFSPRVSSPTHPFTIRMLLKNCIKLLPKEKYPQIVTSAHYMYSDSLVPLNTNPTDPQLDREEEILVKNNIRRKKVKRTNNTVDVKVLSLKASTNTTSSRDDINDEVFNDDELVDIVGNVKLRCELALKHVLEGLKCLHYFDKIDIKTDNSSSSTNDHEEPKVANSSQAIPLPYLADFDDIVASYKDNMSQNERKNKKSKDKKKNDTKSNAKSPVTKSIGTLLCKSQIETIPTWHNPPDSNDLKAWKHHLKVLLYEKACLIYATLAEYEYNSGNYGNALNHIKFVLQSRSGLHNKKYEDSLLSYLLGRAGDCCVQIYRNWSFAESYSKQLTTISAFDDELQHEMELHKAPYCLDLNFFPSKINSLEDIMNHSWMCYNKAIDIEPNEYESNNLKKRLGNICNELASYYINQVGAMVLQMSERNVNSDKISPYCSIAMSHLTKGIELFKSVKDDANSALLCSNYGRLMRIMAHSYFDTTGPITTLAKKYYKKALHYYQLALSALSYRRNYPEIWDTIFWEYSTAAFNFATYLQDCSPSNENVQDLEREVTESITKALGCCDVETPGPKQPLYQFRAAELHRRLASLYHNTYRNLPKDSLRKKKIYDLCHIHYSRAVDIFAGIEEAVPAIRTTLERIAIYEYYDEHSTNNAKKIGLLQNALELILKSGKFLKWLVEKSASEQKSSSDSSGVTLKNPTLVENSNAQNDSSSCNDRMRNEETYEQRKDEEPVGKIIQMFEVRFQYLLRTLIKRCSLLSSQSRYVSLAKTYREMYADLLKRDQNCTVEQHMYNVITKYNKDLS